MKSKWMKLLATLFAVAMVAAACGSDTAAVVEDAVDGADSEALTSAQDALAAAQDAQAAAEAEAEAAKADAEAAVAAAAEGEDAAPAREFEGQVVQVTGPERSPEDWNSIQAAFDAFGEETGMQVIYTGSVNWEQEINVQIAAGNPPDISIFPQPGKLADFARAGSVLELPAAVTDAVSANWADGQMAFGQADGAQVGVPVKTDLKSIVWYRTDIFADGGYEVPGTIQEMKDLTAQMISDGNTPWCVGIESGGATGWLFTDWVEELVMRNHGVEVYDQWVANEVKFSDERITSTFQEILDLWGTDGAVFGGIESIPSTNHSSKPAEDLAAGNCAMVRQASFFAGRIPEEGGENFGWFYFPTATEGTMPVLVAGTLSGAFVDSPAVWAVMEYMGSAEYANLRQTAQRAAKDGGISGFNTANQGADRSLWTDIGGEFLEFMQNAETVRFDGSDLMPPDVGAGEFWTQATAMVNGDADVATAAAAIDGAWPTE